MDSLELEAAVDEVEPGGAVDVHGGAQLALGEGFGVAEVGGRHGPVGEGDLHVQRHGDDVADEHEGDADGPGGEGAPEEAVAEEDPVGEHEGDFGRARPRRGAEVHGARGEQVQPGEEVEVEAGDAHDGVVGVFLVGYEEGRGRVPGEGEVVVGGVQRVEEGRAGDEERDVLDVRVVLRVVGDEVVDVVAAFPPPDRQAAAEVGHEHADQGVGDEIMGDAPMTGVVGGKHYLMLPSCAG